MRTLVHGGRPLALAIGLLLAGLLAGLSSFASAEGKVVSKATDRLWRAKCASCHGPDGRGQTEQGQKMKVQDMTLAEWQRGITDEQIRKTIKEGVNKTEDGIKKEMPPLKDELTDAKITEIIGRVRAFAP